MAGEVKSPQFNPVSHDQSGLSSRSSATADGAWKCPSRVDAVDFSRPVGPTEQIRSGMAAPGSAQEQYPRDTTQTFHDAGTRSQNVWGEDWHGRAGSMSY